jgi:hypothetical protein
MAKTWGKIVKEAHRKGQTIEAKEKNARKAAKAKSKQAHKNARRGKWGWK